MSEDAPVTVAGLPVLPPAELQAQGYLQEVNRRFFHPLGLALAVTLHDDHSLDRLSVLDGRDDIEGIRFEEVDLGPNARRVDAEWRVRAGARWRRLGYVIQMPEPEEVPS